MRLIITVGHVSAYIVVRATNVFSGKDYIRGSIAPKSLDRFSKKSARLIAPVTRVTRPHSQISRSTGAKEAWLQLTPSGVYF